MLLHSQEGNIFQQLDSDHTVSNSATQICSLVYLEGTGIYFKNKTNKQTKNTHPQNTAGHKSGFQTRMQWREKKSFNLLKFGSTKWYPSADST